MRRPRAGGHATPFIHRAADAARDAALATANASWWSAEANAHADRAVVQAATDHAWTIATLAADQARLLAEGLAQKTLRDTQATAYRSAPTGGSQLVLATASATLPGTLAIAAQIGYSLSAAGWQAISDQVGDRMQQWISQISATVITAHCISMRVLPQTELDFTARRAILGLKGALCNDSNSTYVHRRRESQRGEAASDGQSSSVRSL